MAALVSQGSRASARFDFGRIMVVGGKPIWREAIVEALGDAGYEAIAPNADTAAVLDEVEPDLVVLGIEAVDGATVELFQRLRAHRPIPVLVTHSGHLDAVQLLDLGADVLLTEPIRRHELVARVRALFRRTPPRPRGGNGIVGYGGMKLERTDRTLHLERGTLALDDRQFVLMETLMLNGAKVTPRRVLEARLGMSGSEFDGAVRRLRRRVEAIEGWRRIVSARSVGLRLLEEPPGATTPTLPTAIACEAG